MTVEDTRHAIEVAEKAFATFRNTSPVQRSNWLSELYRLYQASINDIARLIVWENGKSWNDAMAEATYAGSFFSWFAAEALRTYGEVIPCSVPGTRNFSIKQPIGVVALLCPWNFPAAMIARKMGPALAVGCTSVIKTPSETPFTTLAITEVSPCNSSCPLEDNQLKFFSVACPTSRYPRRCHQRHHHRRQPPGCRQGTLYQPCRSQGLLHRFYSSRQDPCFSMLFHPQEDVPRAWW